MAAIETKKELVYYWVVRDPDDEVIGILSTCDRNNYLGVTIGDRSHNIDRISEAEYETYREFEIPLYRLDEDS